MAKTIRVRLIRPLSQVQCAESGRECITGQVLHVSQERFDTLNGLRPRDQGRPSDPWFERVDETAKDMTPEQCAEARFGESAMEPKMSTADIENLPGVLTDEEAAKAAKSSGSKGSKK